MQTRPIGVQKGEKRSRKTHATQSALTKDKSWVDCGPNFVLPNPQLRKHPLSLLAEFYLPQQSVEQVSIRAFIVCIILTDGVGII